MKKKYIVSIDQGTTSTRAIIFDKRGEVVALARRELRQIYPMPGYVEHDANEIFDACVATVKEAMQKAGINADEIAAMGITNQRETSVVFDKKTGKPVYNAIVWQCRRTSKFTDELKASLEGNRVYDRSGLIVDAYFSASKLKWLLDTVEGLKQRAKNGEVGFGTIDTFLVYNFTRGKIFKTDYSNASRTMLFNIHNLHWDSYLLELFGVPQNMLCEVVNSADDFGKTDPSFFGVEIPIFAVAGDQQSALFGQLCLENGDVKNTYGTGCFMLMNTKDKPINSKRGLLTTLSASYNSRPDYVLEGSVFVGGAAVQWLRDELGIIQKSSDTEAMAKSVLDNGGVYFVPAFAGLGAPHWDSVPRGMICGLTRGSNKNHIVRSCLEAIAYQVFELLHAMERDANCQINSLHVDGGASENNFLMQFQADILNAKILRPKNLELTALGVCYLAGLKCGFFENIEKLKALRQSDTAFVPNMLQSTRQQLIMGWAEAIARVKSR